MPSAGQLRDRVRFEARSLDENGDRTGAWGAEAADSITVWAQLVTLRGGEGVMDARLQGRQPIVVVVRATPRSRTIDATWRIVDQRTDAVYAISAVNPAPRRDFIEFLAQAEGGNG